MAAPATELLYERTLMLRADARCRLFSPAVSAALTASAAQARGAALRAGVSGSDVQGAAARARTKADATDCRSRDLALAAARLRQAFADYAKLSSMTFPGAHSDWRAIRRRPDPRRPRRPASPQWALVQFLGEGVRPTLVGLQSDDAGGALRELSVANGSPDALAASGARLVLRDPAKAAEPYVDARHPSLAGQMPPRALDRVILARSKSVAPPSLLPRETPHGVLFQFPLAAIDALASLDPREAAAVEFVYPMPSGGERIAIAWIEVGDFAAGRAFLAVGR